MKLKHMFIINAIIALAYAVGTLCFPNLIVKLYYVNNTSTPEIILPLRFFGYGLLALGLLTAFVANTPQSETKQAIVKALLIANIIGLIVSLMGVLGGTFNAFGWSAVVIYVFLVLGYGYFWFIKPETA